MAECCDIDEVAIEQSVHGWKPTLNHCEAVEVVYQLSIDGRSVDQIRHDTRLPERRINDARRELIDAGRLTYHGARLIREMADA